MKKHITALLFSAVFLSAATVSPEANRWWAHVQRLAADEMQGRESGTPGYEKAVAYVSGEFDRLGVRPAGEKGYRQTVRFRSLRIDEAHSSLALVNGGKTVPLTLGDDALFSLRTTPRPEVHASAVFIGYGLKIPELNIDDFKGIDLRGKFAVYINGGPANVPGPVAAHARSLAERSKNLTAAGALGAISITNPKNIEIPWSRSVLARFTSSFSIEDPAAPEAHLTTIVFNVDRAAKLLEGSGHAIADLLAADNEHQPLPHFPLKAEIAAKVATTSERTQSSNVIGVIPGSDPKLSKEYVAVSAHLDHLGIGRPQNGDAIYNGAMDNASGVAALLELAYQLASTPMKRSVLVVVVTGEEKGLLGSKFFMAHPTVNARSIVADINLDMFLPIVPLRAVIAYGSDESSLGPVVREVTSSMNIQVLPDPEPAKNHFIRSDQYNFILGGVPSLALKFAAIPGTPEDAAIHEWMKNRYHAPSDDLQQPVDVEAAGTFVKMMATIVNRIGNTPARPAWNPDSFFSRFAAR